MSQSDLYTTDEPKKVLSRIYSLVHVFAKSPRLDKDGIAQEVWIEADRKKLPITPLLVKNRVIDAWRRLKRRQEVEGSIPQGSPSAIVEFEHVERVHLALEESNLSPIQTEIIYHRFYQDRSQVETATIMGVSVSFVQVETLHALEALRANPSLQELLTCQD